MGNYVRLINHPKSGKAFGAAIIPRSTNVNRSTQDNALPTLSIIRRRFVAGEYSHEIENTVHSLLNVIDVLEVKLNHAERQLEHYMQRQYDV